MAKKGDSISFSKILIVSFSVFNVATSNELGMLLLEARQIQFLKQKFLGILLVLARSNSTNKVKILSISGLNVNDILCSCS